MAGLLDVFGTGGLDSLGLLGMSAEDIKRARDDAQAQAMFALAGRLFQGGNTGASIAQGLQLGQQAYKQAMQGQLADKLQTAQIQDMVRKQQEAQAAKLRMAGAQELMLTALQPQLQPTATTGPGGVPYPVNQIGTASLQDLIPQFARYGAEGFEALKQYTDLQKAVRPETITLSEGQQVFEKTPEGFKAIAGSAKVKPLKEVDLGNVVVLLNEQGREVGRLPKGRAPEGAPTLQHIETADGIAAFNPKTGQITPVMQGGKPVIGKGAGALTEGQGNAVAYGMRMVQANEILKPLENAGLKNTGLIRAGVSGTLGAVPLIGDALARGSDNIFNTLPTILGGLSEDQQKTVQARVNFITAVLRKESGASISPTEFATAEKNYFPAPGESPAIVKQKQDAREMAIKAMKLQAGPTGSKYFSAQPGGVTSSGW